jgi:hypothetical protein
VSFDFEIISAVVGIAASVVAAIGTGFLKSFSDKHQKRDRDKIQEAARSRLTEISINIAGLGVKYQVGRSASPETQVATRLLQEVEQGIVEGVSEREGLSREQVRTEVEDKMTEVRGRLKAIEKRFPDDATIDKIASINDALFAQRIEQLSTRIEKLEEKLLTKWDVALTVSIVAAGIFTVVGATYAVLKVVGQAPGT